MTFELITLNVGEVEVLYYPFQTTINNANDILKGLIYVYGYDASYFEDFQTDFMNQHNLINVEETIWIYRRVKIAKKYP